MRRLFARPGRYALAFSVLAGTLLVAPLPHAHASLPAGRAEAPRAVAPAPDAVVPEAAARLAWTAPPNTARHLVVVSATPFDPSAWTALPEDAAFTVREVAHPVASLADLGIALERDMDLWWAPVSVEHGTERLAFGAAQRTHVLRRFANRVEPSPYLRTLPMGVVAPRADADAEPRMIRLNAGYAFDPAAGEPALDAALRVPRDEAASSRTALVHYGASDPERAREAILASGGRIVSYIPDHTFLVRWAGGARTAVTVDGARLSAFAYHPAYRVSPRMALAPDHAGTVDVLVFQDGDLAAVEAAATTAGATVLARSDNGINKILRLGLTGSAVTLLAAHDDVAWIEPHAPFELHNDLAQWVVQTNINGNRRLWDMGVRGQDQVVCTTDSGINMSHWMFADPAVPLTGFGEYPTHRKVIAYLRGSSSSLVSFGDHSGASYHGSHTAGTVAGDDSLNGGVSTRDGMARYAKLWFMDLSGPALANGIDTFADLNDLYQPSYTGNAAGAARISSNSWGSAVAGEYTLSSLQVDQFMWSHPDYLIFFSNGNSGTAGSVGSPATAKNSVGAGGTRNGTSSNLIYSSTSRGPTLDGRRKPTICAPGQSVTSASSGTTTLATLSGTSMASPSMAGAAALIRQYVAQGWYPTGAQVAANGFAPSAALLKAMCINSADNGVSTFTAPDNNIGYGRIDADNVCYFAGDARKLLLVDQTEGLGHGQAIEYEIQVTNGAIPLEVSLCWTDYPGSPAASVQLVNNLDLTVTNGATTYRGNVYSGGFSVVGGSYDNRNVEEAVLVQSPPVGLWTVRIEGFDVPAGPQPFGLCITGGVSDGAGTLALDRASYGSSSTVQLQVTDTNAGPSVQVTLASTTEPGGEVVTLAGGNGVYTGSFPLSPLAAAAADGQISVSHGDLLTATYDDPAPVATLAATADVAIQTAAITNVRALNQGNGTVLITWDTDLHASSRVYYGDTPGLGEASALDPTAVQVHQHVVSGLVPTQTYYFDVESAELNGNVTRDDNGGAHYKVTVSPPSDLLLVYGGAEFERETYYTSSLATLGWSTDVWRGPLSETPALGDATGGLRAYKAVWWQPGLEYYPPFTNAARDSLAAYLGGGGRLAVTGHDIMWALGDPTSPYYTVASGNWLLNSLRVQYLVDPPGWAGVSGVPGDSISGDYVSTLAYSEHRSGASGDEITVSSATTPPILANLNWRSFEVTPDFAGVRWQTLDPQGAPGNGVWGGKSSRFSGMFFEWSGIDPNASPGSVIRTGIMQKTLTWLIGHDKPAVAVTAPNGGEILTGDSVNLTWTESTPAGVGIASRTLEYSLDGGDSWNLIAAGVGVSPFVWDLTPVPNSGNARVRVRVVDDTHPFLSATDVSNDGFVIQRAGGDASGPVVVAGSIASSVNPIDNQQPATLTAAVTDAGSGGVVAQAEWSEGPTPAAAGTGTAMTGAFGSTIVDVQAVIPAMTLNTGVRTLWVRGRDGDGNWGAARSFAVQVNGQPLVGVGDTPAALALLQNAPNPVTGATDIAFALPVEGRVSLAVFDTQGRRRASLADGHFAAGRHRVRWNAVGDDGRRVAPGVYYYRLEIAGMALEKRMAVIQ